ncbi:MAG: 50S ribosomal protein L32 [Patescibacteria group bacterium]|nr:50S ribosomal protein L32 [Patescibacteria group bacterium]
MSVRMRHTRGHTGNRRSHHALAAPRLSLCGKCGEGHLRHTMCGNCGTYRGREVVDVLAQVNRKASRAKAKAHELGKEEKKEEQSEKSSAGKVSPEASGKK